MDELQAKHRRQLRDLQGRITQKKKAASKKTRKGVNEECARLEDDLKARQADEIAALAGPPPAADTPTADDPAEPPTPDDAQPPAQPSPELHRTNDAPATDEEDDRLKKPNRQKARLARRAAEQSRLATEAAAEAALMPDARAVERAGMLASFARLGLHEKEVRADGHCLYAAVADQLAARGTALLPDGEKKEEEEEGREGYRVVRGGAAGYISEHADEFAPYLEESVEGYVAKVRDTGEWGGQVELLALARAYEAKISVLQGDGSVVDVGEEGEEGARLWVAYYRHGFGLGEHYNSLRRAKPAVESSKTE
jgi:OTU domain-containing protein 6